MIRRQGQGGSTLLQRLRDVWKVWEEMIFIGSKTPTVHNIWPEEEPLQKIPQLHTKSWLKKFISASVMNPARCLCAVAPWEQHWPAHPHRATLVSLLPFARRLIGDSPLLARFQDMFAPQANSPCVSEPDSTLRSSTAVQQNKDGLTPAALCRFPPSHSHSNPPDWISSNDWGLLASFINQEGGGNAEKDGQKVKPTNRLCSTSKSLLYTALSPWEICVWS